MVSQDGPSGKKTGNWGAGDRKPFPGHVVHWGQWDLLPSLCGLNGEGGEL